MNRNTNQGETKKRTEAESEIRSAAETRQAEDPQENETDRLPVREQKQDAAAGRKEEKGEKKERKKADKARKKAEKEEKAARKEALPPTRLQRFYRNPFAVSAALAVVLNLIIESFARQSPLGGAAFLADRPAVFAFNSLIIFTALITALIFRHRLFWYVVVSALWLTVGAINGVILRNRMTPFTVKDFGVFKDGLSIVTNYLSLGQLLLAAAGGLLALAGLLALFFLGPRRRAARNLKRDAILLVLTLAVSAGVLHLGVQKQVVQTFFGNLGYAYRDNGLPYCFLSTWLNTGVKKPTGYSEAAVEGILGREDPRKTDPEGDYPNIIMLQLESFIDPESVKFLKLSEDAIPHFREMENRFSSGWLTVPSVGAGTANTEFEVLSGMSVRFFGPGEYPYKSILTKRTCETMAYDLKALGFSTHAIHNHRAAFYGRNQVFRNLGFDTFTSLEYMNNVLKTPKNWAKDGILTGEIMAALTSTEGKDFVYTISVQGHGKYPAEPVLRNPKVLAEIPGNPDLAMQYQYFVNQLYEMDLFVKNLTDVLDRYGEKVVVVMYGDHIPALEVTEDQLESGDLHKTPYVIWSNFKMDTIDQNYTSYQIGAALFQRLGIYEGTLTRFHQSSMNDPDYQENLKMLQYDMLYGKGYVFKERPAPLPTNLKMGVRPVRVTSIVQIGDRFFIKGENFTEFSKVSLNGKVLKTLYLSPTVLGLRDKVDPEEAGRMKVSQIEKNNKEILSTTE